ncbi:unnamed protein product [Schistocephalus solidus]|uniref:26S proteasome non-ATPase regulatory subunit 5 n=1 Tax=Schistocephalus solidus TaxID=70667 RepID=A0A183TP38_SCHSO|nr:unnamed protein product [Schistocephalus solidus]
MERIPPAVVEILEKVSAQAGTIQDYEKLYILLKNLPSSQLEAAVSAYNLLDIFVYMDLDNRAAEPGVLSHVLPTLGRLLQNSPPELLTRVLNVLADVLRLPRSMPVDGATPLAHLTWLWLSRISGSPAPEAFKNDALKVFARVWALARQPFYDVRQAALLLLEAIMTEPWGITLLMDQAGFVEYLLNRSTENSLASEGVSLLPVKFSIISQAYNTQEKWCGTCPQWREIDEETLARLREYVRCGPWGSVRAEAAVAIEQG